MNCLISIIVPVYNSETFISECIESIMKQTYSEFELLLINDGSQDNSGSICKEYSKCDSRIRYYEKPNEGVSATRNLGLKYAIGQYVTFVDSDDIIEPNYLQSLICQKDFDLVVSGFISKQNKQYLKEVKFPNLTIYLNNFNRIFDRILTYGTPWAKLFKMEIIKKYNIHFNTKLSLHEDHLFYFEYIKRIQSIAIIEDVQYIYVNRLSGKSLSRDTKLKSQEKLLAYKLLNSELISIISNNKINKTLVPKSLNFITRILISAINTAICENNDIHMNEECKNIIKHHYTPTSLMGKFQKICIVYLPFCLYKKLIKINM